MEFKMNEYELPAKIGFNFEELKQELTNKIHMYETLVYTDEQIKEAKTDKANLNKMKKALNDERIKREKEYMQPFNEFKAQVNEIISIIDKPIMVIDKQIKEYEEKQKQDKLEKINELMKIAEAKLPDEIHIPIDPKWLNATVTMKSIQTAIDDATDKIIADMDTLSDLPEYSFEAQQVYKNTLDIRKALEEAHRMSDIAKKKAEQEERLRAEQERLKEVAAQAIEPKVEEFIPPVDELKAFEAVVDENFIPTFPKEPEKEWLVIKAKVSASDKEMIEQYFRNNGIEFKFM